MRRLADETKYVVHIRTLKQTVNHGLGIKKGTESSSSIKEFS